MRKFEKAFKLPFVTDEIMYIFDSDNNMVLQTIKHLDKENMIGLCNQLNGNRDATYKNDWQYDKRRQVVTQNGRDMYDIRGWGYLTGTGALNLPDDEAIEIQDDLGLFIVERMTRRD